MSTGAREPRDICCGNSCRVIIKVGIAQSLEVEIIEIEGGDPNETAKERFASILYP